MTEKKFNHSNKYAPIKQMNTWLAINPSYGCTNGCGYCINLKDRDHPQAINSQFDAETTLDLILNNPLITSDIPLAFYNESDPFLKKNHDDLVKILYGLEKKGFKNIAGIITKTMPSKRTIKFIKQLENLKPVVLVSNANLEKMIVPRTYEERVKITKQFSKKGLLNNKVPTILYLRPVVREWYRGKFEEKMEQLAHDLNGYADAVVVSGLIYTEEIKHNLVERNIKINNPKRKIPLPNYDPGAGKRLQHQDLADIKRIFSNTAPDLPVFTNTSCAVSYVFNHPNYIGYYGLRKVENKKGCIHSCIDKQRKLCRKGKSINKRYVRKLLDQAGRKDVNFKIGDNYILLHKEVGSNIHYFLRNSTHHWTFAPHTAEYKRLK